MAYILFDEEKSNYEVASCPTLGAMLAAYRLYYGTEPSQELLSLAKNFEASSSKKDFLMWFRWCRPARY